MNAALFEPLALVGVGAAACLYQRRAPKPKAVAWRTRLAEAGAFAMAMAIPAAVRVLYVLPSESAARPLRVLGGLLAADFVFYLLHRFCHGSLWRLHRNHHAAEHFDTGIAFRDSALHLFVFAALFGVLQVGLSLTVEDTALISAALIAMQWWTHTRTWVSLGVLDWVFIGPRHHYLHHAPAEGHRLVNLGTFLCVWDQLLGSYQHPPKVSPLTKPMPPRRESADLRAWLGV
jgi:sterol desaturase/sphingolipid hydroxylase (fatty acid hydroxylase superfamily)